ncbi:MAG: bifunctional UDP-N-acetylglucosamine diphosphorylase/glucosamine-1-phosphate N-acetyltransferase GlmU [Myxococcota bacterium]|nr:bifunctional UDP-N-acetylglucosamine diphosphorylase/glucosamine-1-phosphate N-acetyltransferase GlmU [Myxococcota bacterium]
MPDANQQPDAQPDARRPLAVIVLAAGQGTRMKSRRAKVLHEMAGRPLLGYPLAVAEALAPEEVVVVVGRDADQVTRAFEGRARFVHQEEQRGTGHAVQVALPALGDFEGDVLVLYGDSPLVRVESLEKLRACRAETGSPVAMLTAPEPLPGRILRGPDGRVERIVEVTDATPEELEIQEGNTGVYWMDGAFLRDAIGKLDPSNAQGELYLTDVVAIARAQGLPVEAVVLDEGIEALGVNTRGELARASAEQFRRNAQHWMDEGVTFTDPDATWIDTDVEIGRDTRIDPGVVITAGSRLGEGVWVKPHCMIEDSRLGDDSVIGPSAHLRPGCELGNEVRIGNFVEVKNSVLGDGVKADHLSYVGDADVAPGASFGCGSITVNYDWVDKHRTTVGAGARIGCNVNLVAPVTIEDEAYVAAGTTVTKTVPKDAIAVGAPRQRHIEGWGLRKKRAKAAKQERKGQE